VWNCVRIISDAVWEIMFMVAPRGAGGCHLIVSRTIASTYDKDDLSSNSGNLSVPTKASISVWARFQMRGFLTIASVNTISTELVCGLRKCHIHLSGRKTDRLYRA
jgi:hypothetical protein